MSVIDLVFPKLRTLNGTLQFFRKGWGDSATRHNNFLHQIQTHNLPPPKPLDITYSSLPNALSIGQFTSPAKDILPPSSHTARFLLVPAHGRTDRLVLQLAATGEHGFLRRYLTLAHALRRRNVTSVILESPFYGSRRPHDQFGALLNHVADLPDLGRATIEEARALLAHFRSQLPRQVVTGVSQGGLHAAMTAVAIGAERQGGDVCDVGVVMALAPHSAVPVFTSGVLSACVDWRALAKHDGLLTDDSTVNTCRQLVMDRMKQALRITDIDNFPPVQRMAQHVLLFAESDR